jgi:hypothetical protein
MGGVGHVHVRVGWMVPRPGIAIRGSRRDSLVEPHRDSAIVFWFVEGRPDRGSDQYTFEAAGDLYILDHSQARMCFSEPALAPLAAEAGAGNILSELPRLEPTDVALPEVDPDQPSAILYTSGTTARPKV